MTSIAVPRFTTVNPEELCGHLYSFHGAINNSFRLTLLTEQHTEPPHTYEVVEDENDGYRSNMKDLRKWRTDHGPNGAEPQLFYSQALEVVTVKPYDPAIDDTPGDVYLGDGNELWQVSSVLTAHQWVLFGTVNTNDYYPCFTFRYNPHDGSQHK